MFFLKKPFKNRLGITLGLVVHIDWEKIASTCAKVLKIFFQLSLQSEYLSPSSNIFLLYRTRFLFRLIPGKQILFYAKFLIIRPCLELLRYFTADVLETRGRFPLCPNRQNYYIPNKLTCQVNFKLG